MAGDAIQNPRLIFVDKFESFSIKILSYVQLMDDDQVDHNISFDSRVLRRWIQSESEEN